ncbi:hypothetical protein HYDPIDRAFT_41400 [Hydnomerulius pinastri MD-312]|uniref:Uncharacterized protein n=1 Tax=Hydnomerulius pinastri MD-312 TaxID=994086 RepID=A0A0C9WDL7_9AGAM|nr:hypothetical protein HYDPIDRAFT_41400 [Hydnomerulius pinastri MD-312]
MFVKTLAIAAVGFAASAAASCSYSTRGDGYEFYVYGETGCGTGNHYEEFYGAGVSAGCPCTNLASSMNDNVYSFVFTASEHHEIRLYKDADCQGTQLGYSRGNWMDTSVSSAGQGTSSFSLCYDLTT